MEVTMNPDELTDGMSQGLLNKKYNEKVEVRNAGYKKENLSDMVSDHSLKQANKKKEKESKKKEKEYKF